MSARLKHPGKIGLTRARHTLYKRPHPYLSSLAPMGGGDEKTFTLEKNDSRSTLPTECGRDCLRAFFAYHIPLFYP
jgi:hypothetical protein